LPESIADSFPHKDTTTASIEQETLLGRAATLADVGNVAAFVASDLARTMTATEVNISCGALVD
jgi:enoyl-[acyl-carrier-protein] reductase (NADH)